jgi:hypothetical protein
MVTRKNNYIRQPVNFYTVCNLECNVLIILYTLEDLTFPPITEYNKGGL